MCGLTHGSYTCNGNGYFWDTKSEQIPLDNKDLPCPRCNMDEYLAKAKADAESTTHFSGTSLSGLHSSGTGVDIWTRAVTIVSQYNPDTVKSALKKISKVEAIYEDPKDRNSILVKLFNYQS